MSVEENTGVAATAAKKKPGPKSAADLRAELEAEIRAEILAEKDNQTAADPVTPMDVEQIKAAARAEFEAELVAKERAAEEARRLAAEARPIRGSDVDGDPAVDGSITVHFVDDGLTLLGKVWMRGEELTINPGTAQWDEAHKVLQMDEYEQESKWNRRFFREGPWRGLRWDQIKADGETIREEDLVALKKIAQEREARYGTSTRR